MPLFVAPLFFFSFFFPPPFSKRIEIEKIRRTRRSTSFSVKIEVILRRRRRRRDESVSSRRISRLLENEEKAMREEEWRREGRKGGFDGRESGVTGLRDAKKVSSPF